MQKYGINIRKKIIYVGYNYSVKLTGRECILQWQRGVCRQ